MRGTRTCTWCGLPGHEERSCHVKAEGRREPDAADREACRLLEGVFSQRGGSPKTSAAEGRALVAARLRGPVA